jgi:rSAM/selenodomain-associated transferase 2
MVSVIIPVYREAEHIEATIRSLDSAAHDVPHEVIVVDGDPAGGTIASLPECGVNKLTAPKGRARQMNAGAVRAAGDILLFLHADTLLPSGALRKIIRVMEDPRYVGGAFALGFQARGWVYAVTGMCASLKHRLTRVPYGDQAIFMRKDYFESLGGYPEIPLMEDVELMKRVKRRGGRIVLLPDAVATSARRWEADGILYTMVRNWTLQALYLFGVPAERLVRYYYKGV